MEDSEIQDFVHRHMGRLDEPMRTYAAELAKAVNDAAIEELAGNDQRTEVRP